FDNEIAGWERAFAYEANREKLSAHLSQIPVRENEWDRRHVPYELANAEHLAMSASVGMITYRTSPFSISKGLTPKKCSNFFRLPR
ncbi:MAG: hypothetical protein VX211_07095, partial [Pseudomonadota bacterium]|nr:hypothetical protein [Pseudomonadota bacterium]